MTNHTLDLLRENKIQNISGVGPQQVGTVQDELKHNHSQKMKNGPSYI